MGLSYAWQKFHGAIHSLTSELPLRQRLNYAIASNLIHLKEEDLPKDIQPDFKALVGKVTSVEAEHGEGNITATLNALSDEELSFLKNEIISLHDQVCRAYGKSRND